MANNEFEEFNQRQLEKAVCEQYELHGWATAVSVANPLEILIIIEEDDEYDEIQPKPVKGVIL